MSVIRRAWPRDEHRVDGAGGTDGRLPPDPRWRETRRELAQMANAVLVIDVIAIGLGALAARPMGAFAYRVGLGIAMFVSFCFLLLVVLNLLVVVVADWWNRTSNRG